MASEKKLCILQIIHTTIEYRTYPIFICAFVSQLRTAVDMKKKTLSPCFYKQKPSPEELAHFKDYILNEFDGNSDGKISMSEVRVT